MDFEAIMNSLGRSSFVLFVKIRISYNLLTFVVNTDYIRPARPKTSDRYGTLSLDTMGAMSRQDSFERSKLLTCSVTSTDPDSYHINLFISVSLIMWIFSLSSLYFLILYYAPGVREQY